jgi:hypothetical protein
METESQIEQVSEEVTGTREQGQVANATERLLPQEEVNRIVADRVERERKKFERRFEGVDLDRYQQLVEAEEARKLEDQKRRGEFEEILKSTVSKKDTVITGLQQELQSIKVDGAMLNIASKHKAINPEQVVSLVKNQVKLSETGDVEVIDPRTGSVRYTESGDAMDMESLISEFLEHNPHFVSATTRGSGTVSNTRDAGVGKPLNIAALDMNNPEHRKQYAEYRRQNGIAR